MNTATNILSLALSLVGSFEGIVGAPVTKGARWGIAKELVEVYGIKGCPRINADDLTVLGHFALVTAFASAEAEGLVLEGTTFVAPVAAVATVTLTAAQRTALVGLARGIECNRPQTVAALVRHGLAEVRGTRNRQVLTDAGYAMAAPYFPATPAQIAAVAA